MHDAARIDSAHAVVVVAHVDIAGRIERDPDRAGEVGPGGDAAVTGEALVAGAADDPQLPVGVDPKDRGVLAVDAVEVAGAVEDELLGAALREPDAGLDVADRPRVPCRSAAARGSEREEHDGRGGSQRSLDPDRDHRLRRRPEPAKQAHELRLPEG